MTFGTNESIILTDGTSDSVTYQLINTKDQSLVFKGKAYRYPDADYLQIDLTDVAHDLVSPAYLSTSDGLPTDPDMICWAELKLVGNTTQTFTVRYWNSFDEPAPTSTYLFNDPAGLTVDPGSWLYPMCSGPFYLYNGSKLLGSYNSGITKIDLNDFNLNSGDVLRLTSGTQDVKYRVRCGGHYDLLYQNSKGAIDTLTCYGHCTKKASAEHSQMTRNAAYSPSNLHEHIKKNYVGVSNLSWNLQTGMMTEQGSQKMPEVAMSNRAWLHDIQTGSLYAVNIFTDEFSTKIFKKDHGSMSYSIEVELARDVVYRN